MALDPQARQVLDMVQKSGAPEMWQLTPDEARAEYVKRTQRAKPEIDIYQSRDEKIPGSDGPISIRIYTPRPAKENELFSVLVWFHGGGFVIGDLDTHDSACRALANEADGLEASVRMLGEARHPAAVVHRPAVLLGEVVAQGATGELLRGRTEVVHAFGVVVSVMGDEQEGVDRGPLGTQRKRLEYGGHGLGAHAPANVSAGRSISILNDSMRPGGVRRKPAPDES